MVNYKHLVSHVSTALSLDEDYVARVLRRSDLPELFSAFNSLRETKVTALFSYNTAAPLLVSFLSPHNILIRYFNMLPLASARAVYGQLLMSDEYARFRAGLDYTPADIQDEPVDFILLSGIDKGDSLSIRYEPVGHGSAIYVIIQRDADIARFRVRTPDDLSELSRAVLEAQDYWQMKRGDVKNL